MAGIPIGIGHLGAVGFDPVEVFDVRAVDGAALEKMAAAEDRLRLAQAQQLAREIEQRALFGGELPVEPRERRVLAVGVVVAVLGLAEFIAGEEHRHALREEQRGEEVPLLPRAQAC